MNLLAARHSALNLCARSVDTLANEQMSSAFCKVEFRYELQKSDTQMVKIEVALAQLVDRIGGPRARRNALQGSYAVSCNFSKVILDRRLFCCFEYLYPIEGALSHRYTGLARQIILGMHGEVTIVIFVQVGERVAAREGEVADVDLKFHQCRVRSLHQNVIGNDAVDG